MKRKSRRANPLGKVLTVILLLLAVNYFSIQMNNTTTDMPIGMSDIPVVEKVKSNAFISYVSSGINNVLDLAEYVLPSLGAFNKTEENIDNQSNEYISFNDVPKGALYFDEEDTYNPEDAANPFVNPKPTSPVTEAIAEPIPIELAKKEPSVLIYHTHATESYMPWNQSNYHSQEEKYNVVNVGTVLANTLQKKYGLRVIHDKTYHDKESYSLSYANSLKTIKAQMAKNKELKVFIDLHRDAFSVANESQKKQSKENYTATINGKKAAKVMLVVGKNNPNYTELLKFATCIEKKMNTMYPGLLLKMNVPEKKYNQYNSNYSILIEMGCMLNTTEEAKYTAELMGNVIGEVMKDLKK